jgi:tetratricopeptide (TPR) repeat protein
MGAPHAGYRIVFRVTVALLVAACAGGVLQALVREGRPPGIALEYGSYVHELMERQQWDEAAREMDLALRLDPTVSKQGAERALAQALARSGRLDEALVRMRAALAAAPDDAALHAEMGNVLAARGEFAPALAAYRRAAALDPALPDLQAKMAWARGNTLRERGRLDEAIASYREALAAQPGLAEVRYDLGVTLAARGALEEAIHELATLAGERPREARFHLALGMALAQAGRGEDAAAAYRRGLEIRPDDVPLQRALARLETRGGAVR